MPTDELKQRIEEMKIAAQKAHELMEVCEEEWFDSEHLQRSVRFVSEDADFIEACSPPAILALVSELERLQGENERQRAVVDAAVEWRRVGYERKDEFQYRIGPLLDAIDIYDVGHRRPTTEYTGDDD